MIEEEYSLNLEVRKERFSFMLTPFIDIIFLITLFFVLNTKFDQFKKIDVDLPTATHGKTLQGELIQLVLTKTGELYLNGEETTWQGLSAEIERFQERSSSQKEVSIVADKGIRYESIVQAMDILYANNLFDIGLGIRESTIPKES